MLTATITSKGQITIPKSVRDLLHVHCGDKIAFIMHGQSEALMKPVTKTVDQVFSRLHKSGQTTRTIAEMNEAIAKTDAERKGMIALTAKSSGCNSGITFDRKASKYPFFYLLTNH